MAKIKVLVLEDNPDDAELTLHALRRAAFDVDLVRVESDPDFRRVFDTFEPDIILSDFSLPRLNAMSALAIARQRRPYVPFIFVSGTIGEERAIESFKHGATDHVLKTNLARLGPVVHRALGEADQYAARERAERELLESEAKFRAIVNTTQEWFWEIDQQGRCTFNSPFVYTLLGHRPEELLGTHRFVLVHADDQIMLAPLLPGGKAEKEGWTGLVLRWRRKDGSYRWLESNAIPLLDTDDRIVGYRGADRDVTERKKAEQELEIHGHRLEKVVAERTAELARMNEELKQAYHALEEVSLTDPLTGLKNRRFLLQHLEGDVLLSLRRYEDWLVGVNATLWRRPDLFSHRPGSLQND